MYRSVYNEVRLRVKIFVLMGIGCFIIIKGYFIGIFWKGRGFDKVNVY